MPHPKRRARRVPTPSKRSALVLTMLGLALALSGCAESDEPPGEAGGDATRGREADPRPSIVLIVVESLRSDAVASYGPDRNSPLPLADGTATPRLDALAAKGLRYAWAVSSSPETVPSHASLFTGEPPERHGAGLWTRPGAAPDLELLAQTLAREGYETVGFSENPMVGPDFGLDRGFERFATPRAGIAARLAAAGRSPGAEFGVVDRVKRWLADRDPTRPYFLFVNLADPHLPLAHREGNRFLPKDVSATRIRRVAELRALHTRLCRKLPDPEALRILAGLYLAEVEAADRKLGEIVEQVGRDARDRERREPVALLTADHGTHLGERDLLGHSFSLDERVLRVPLVVVGAPGVGGDDPGLASTGTISTPVSTRRVYHSIRCWSGSAAHCAEALPRNETVAEPEAAPPIVSVVGNEVYVRPPAAVVDTGFLDGRTNYASALCPRASGLVGRSLAWLRAPHKYTWHQYAPARLHDLGWDPAERSDQLERQPDLAARLGREVEARVTDSRLDQPRREPPQAALRTRAVGAYRAGLRALLAAEQTQVDAVWFAQLSVRARPDPELEAWIERQKPLHADDPYYPIIEPTRVSSQPLPADRGAGLNRWGHYLLSAMADPEERAMERLGEYLAMQAEGYILTHQLTALEWARAMGRPLPPQARGRRAQLVEAIADEHARDPVFSDLWIERAALLTVYGGASREQIERWSERLVEHHLGDGDWGHGGTDLAFDGQKRLIEHAREHLRGLALVVLAHYLGPEETASPLVSGALDDPPRTPTG